MASIGVLRSFSFTAVSRRRCWTLERGHKDRGYEPLELRSSNSAINDDVQKDWTTRRESAMQSRPQFCRVAHGNPFYAYRAGNPGKIQRQGKIHSHETR